MRIMSDMAREGSIWRRLPTRSPRASFRLSRKLLAPTSSRLAGRPARPLHPPEVHMANVRSLTLADVAIPRAGAITDLLLVVGASIVTALAAQVAIPVPWSPVPITGQTFAVLLCGAVL